MHLNPLTVFGLIAVTLVLVFYGLERRSRCYIGFAAACPSIITVRR
jgi:hypothetical protein